MYIFDLQHSDHFPNQQEAHDNSGNHYHYSWLEALPPCTGGCGLYSNMQMICRSLTKEYKGKTCNEMAVRIDSMTKKYKYIPCEI